MPQTRRFAVAKSNRTAKCTTMYGKETMTGWEVVLAEAKELERQVLRIEVALGPESLLQASDANLEVLDQAADNIGGVR